MRATWIKLQAQVFAKVYFYKYDIQVVVICLASRTYFATCSVLSITSVSISGLVISETLYHPSDRGCLGMTIIQVQSVKYSAGKIGGWGGVIKKKLALQDLE